jgi:hypothetical protein
VSSDVRTVHCGPPAPLTRVVALVEVGGMTRHPTHNGPATRPPHPGVILLICPSGEDTLVKLRPPHPRNSNRTRVCRTRRRLAPARTPADREPPAPGPRRHPPRGHLPHPHRQHPTHHDVTAQPRHQPPAPRGPHHHRQRTPHHGPPLQPTTRTTRNRRLNSTNDFAGSLPSRGSGEVVLPCQNLGTGAGTALVDRVIDGGAVRLRAVGLAVLGTTCPARSSPIANHGRTAHDPGRPARHRECLATRPETPSRPRRPRTGPRTSPDPTTGRAHPTRWP